MREYSFFSERLTGSLQRHCILEDDYSNIGWRKEPVKVVAESKHQLCFWSNTFIFPLFYTLSLK